MKTISLNGVIPNIFTDRPTVHSEVWHCSLLLERGQHYLFSAESGAGKSSLCSFLYGVRNDYQGTIAFDGDNIANFKYNKWGALRRTALAYLPQDLRLFNDLSSMENVLLKNRITKARTKKEIDELFDLLGIADKRESVVGKLSIGQQQRVAIIRTLCQRADFYLLDEPVSHLDPTNNQLIGALFLQTANQYGASVLATSVGYTLDFPFTHHIQL